MSNSELSEKLWRAVWDWDRKEIARLVNAGADLNVKDDHTGDPILIDWIEDGFTAVEFLEFLLKLGANPNVTDNFGNTPLDVARGEERQDIEEILLRFGAEPGKGDPKSRELPITPSMLELIKNRDNNK